MRGSRGALVRGVAVVALVLGSLLGPVGARPALAADDGLSLVSSAAYSLVPDKGLVHVAVDVTATNNKPNRVQQTPNGTLTTRYFYDAAGIVIQAEATAIRASVGKVKLAATVTKEDGFAVVKITFRSDLNYKQTTKFRVDYDLPGGAPRSDSDIRVGSAFATFYAWAVGDHGAVRIVIPAGFEVVTTGSTVSESVKDGITTLAATGIDDTGEWYAVVVADRHDALTKDRLDLAAGEHLVIRAWPEDTEWRTRVGDLLRVGLPVLVEKIGLDWPVEGDIEVAEVHTPLLEGYAGVFHTNEDLIEISEDLDELTIIHEASHAWFNPDLFSGRWIGEGFADEYASRVLDEVSTGGLRPDPLTPTSEGNVDLNTWSHPGRIADEETSKREHFGYEASWTVVRTLLDEIGEDSMRKVLAAANADETAYRGATDPEKVTIQNDWRRFLDLLDEVGGSKTADELFRRWVVSPDQEVVLKARDGARVAYAALIDAGDGWQPGYAVREPMGRWEFGRATKAITDATSILSVRDQIALAGADLGVVPPDSLREAYEGATADFDSARSLAADQLQTVTSLAATADQVKAERDVFMSIGLIGEDPVASLTAATEDFAAGDIEGADAGRESLDLLLADAGNNGRTRALLAGGGAVGVLLLAGGAVVALRRSRRPLDPVEIGGPMVPLGSMAHPMDPQAPLPSPIGADPYATLGDPRPDDAAADAPAEPGRDKGDDT